MNWLETLTVPGAFRAFLRILFCRASRAALVHVRENLLAAGLQVNWPKLLKFRGADGIEIRGAGK